MFFLSLSFCPLSTGTLSLSLSRQMISRLTHHVLQQGEQHEKEKKERVEMRERGTKLLKAEEGEE